ncbi:MAG: glycosyltransferase, partial [Candidatus Kapabacteria bacterium]|nr:glycosyltransferase [Candidatus Kapabacteria bacterium]
RTLNPNVQYRLLTNGVDLDTLAQYADNSIRRDLVFAGKLDVWANTMMVQKIVHEILPLIRERVPDVRLHVVGGYPPRSIKKLQSESVILHANVPDVRAYLREAAVFIHPHNGASGIQNKVLEAMSSGCAVVTTPTGIHGIPAWHQREVMIGNSTDELARHAAALLTDHVMRDTIAERAQQLVNEQFAWETIYSQLDKCIDEIYPPTRIQTPGYDVDNISEKEYKGLAGQIRHSALSLEKKTSYKRISK